jgi:hypothetical protein
MADSCPDCGRPLTHCFFPGDHVCLRVALNAARRGLAAWEALAFHVADKGGAIDCLRAEPEGCCFLFVSDWQSGNDTPTKAATWLAREMRLIPEAK